MFPAMDNEISVRLSSEALIGLTGMGRITCLARRTGRLTKAGWALRPAYGFPRSVTYRISKNVDMPRIVFSLDGLFFTAFIEDSLVAGLPIDQAIRRPLGDT